jgi:hypothetical protein|tara:strand:+ start:1202 stop:1447 length:246 start_codon:yes stop_codon:yes gene_type:complete
MKAIRLERVADRAGHNDAREAHTMGVIDTIKSEIAHQFSDANRESTVVRSRPRPTRPSDAPTRKTRRPPNRELASRSSRGR